MHEEIEDAAAAALPLCSIDVTYKSQQHSGINSQAAEDKGRQTLEDTQRADLSRPHQGILPSEAICRVWGGRPFQPVGDNSAKMQMYWTQTAEIRFKPTFDAPADRSTITLNQKVLEDLKQLSPGVGPGVPPHMALSFKPLPSRITDIVAGGTFILVLTADRELYIAGHGLNGQLGQGPKIGVLRELEHLDFSTTAHKDRRDRASNIVEVAAGDAHALAVTADGSLFVWGSAYELGLGLARDVHRPTLMQQNCLQMKNKRVVAAAAHGRKSACLTDDGSLYMWGAWPSRATMMEALEIARIVLDDTSLRSAKISLGASFGLILLKLKNGEVRLYQFGKGVRGEILKVTEADYTFAFERVSLPKQLHLLFLQVVEEWYDLLVPECITKEVINSLRSSGPQIIEDIACGDHHAVVLLKGGKIVMYGDNTWYQCAVTGDQETFLDEPCALSFEFDSMPIRVIAGPTNSGTITERGGAYIWGCSQDYRNANTGIKLSAEAPMRSLADKTKIASLNRGSTIGTSTKMSIPDSIGQPERILPISFLHVTAMTFGANFTAIGTGELSITTEVASHRLNPQASRGDQQ